MTTHIIFNETDLASRRTAGQVRSTVEEALERNERAVLDFTKVESVSESYADELIGVLVAAYSLPWVFERVEFKGLRAETAHTFASVIKYRLNTTTKANPLVVVREALRRKREAETCV